MKGKVVIATALTLTLFSATGAVAGTEFPHAGPNRPSNGSYHATPIKGHPIPATSTNQLVTNGVISYSPPGTHYATVYTEPYTIKVSIYDRDAFGAENFNTYHQTLTVDFETYVKDVLPNEWYESWGGAGGAQEALKAGALAVKTWAMYHVAGHPKDQDNNADVTNGTSSQMYTQDSHLNKTNCNAAVDAVANYVIGNIDGDLYETQYFANHALDGKGMSQNGTKTDALNGMSFGSIITKMV